MAFSLHSMERSLGLSSWKRLQNVQKKMGMWTAVLQMEAIREVVSALSEWKLTGAFLEAFWEPLRHEELPGCRCRTGDSRRDLARQTSREPVLWGLTGSCLL